MTNSHLKRRLKSFKLKPGLKVALGSVSAKSVISIDDCSENNARFAECWRELNSIFTADQLFLVNKNKC